jgi:hypothetical protein
LTGSTTVAKALQNSQAPVTETMNRAGYFK